MAYDEELATRIRQTLGPRMGLTEKKMFGGLAFLIDGKMFCGIVKDDLMVRVGPDSYEQALTKPHARPMDFTGRPMNGYVFVDSAGLRTGKALGAWIEQGAAFVAKLPTADRSHEKARPRTARSPRGRSR